PIADPEAVVRIADAANVRITGSAEDARTYLDGEDVSTEIRIPEISLYASAVSAVPGVRRRLAGMQRELALAGGGVLEGRDIGTKVVPGTPHKFFLTARPEVRAQRRFKELLAKGNATDLQTVLAETIQRDTQDSTRADSPLAFDESYTVIDTSDRTIDEVVDAIVEHVSEHTLSRRA